MRSPVRQPFPIALLTDFGYRDHYAGVMKGVIAGIAPGATLIDLTHGIPPQSVTAGAIALRESWRYFPRGTVFVAVVDPGVGTDRRPLAIETLAGCRLVGPDNGLLFPAADQAGIARIVELTAPRYRLRHLSSTFHGRDIFAPAAAYLWKGTRIDSLGPRVDKLATLHLERPVESDREISGTVMYIDGYGNLVTNIDRAGIDRLSARFSGRRLWVKILRVTPLPITNTYGEAPKGAPLATFGSFELLEVAIRDGSAAKRFAAQPGTPVKVRVS
ncbi:MAG: SAM-dependent chlorinase/fluorinase [Candidatus Binataceae bacterium]|nr:SAM-dependent chlorinase/fluorinase [Candidatus Binataceae bacterium]